MMLKKQTGFVLIETLVVSVAVMGIFSLIYANYYPLIGEYEKREYYDDVDSKYIAHWTRKILVDKRVNNDIFTMNSCGGNCHILYGAYYKEELMNGNMVKEKNVIIDETDSILGANASYLQNYIFVADIQAIIVTSYNITNFKNYVKSNNVITTVNEQNLINTNIFNRGFREYLDYLPNYKTPSTNGANYRVIVIINHNSTTGYNSYGTIEVKA